MTNKPKESAVRINLMHECGYTPYCGNDCCTNLWPRTEFNGEQFVCPACHWESEFDSEFIDAYKKKWKPLKSVMKDHAQEMYDLIDESTDIISHLFKQLLVGNWEDENNHKVRKNVAVVDLGAHLKKAIDLRFKIHNIEPTDKKE